MIKRSNMIFISAISVIVTLLVVATSFLMYFRVDLSRFTEQITLMRKMSQIDKYVTRHYYFDSKNNSDELAKAYVSTLGDDYAAYFSKEDYEDKSKDWEGMFYGIGITVATSPKTKETVVVYVNEKSPAKEDGIQKNDIVLKVNGVSAKEKTVEEISKMIRGKKDKKVKLELKRGDKTVEINTVCRDFVQDSVIYRTIDSLGYLQITNFDGATLDQFKTAIKELEKQNVHGLIIDVRNNPGGLVDSCIDILDILLPEGDLLKVQFKDKSTKVLGKSKKSEIDLPIAVLINENSASAAEVFALNIKDYSKGKLIGTKSFGKAVMQTTYSLVDGTAIKFTTALIVDKDNKTYNKKGIEPDFKVELLESDKDNFYFLKDSEDPQLQKAIWVLKNVQKW